MEIFYRSKFLSVDSIMCCLTGSHAQTSPNGNCGSNAIFSHYQGCTIGSRANQNLKIENCTLGSRGQSVSGHFEDHTNYLRTTANQIRITTNYIFVTAGQYYTLAIKSVRTPEACGDIIYGNYIS